MKTTPEQEKNIQKRIGLILMAEDSYTPAMARKQAILELGYSKAVES